MNNHFLKYPYVNQPGNGCCAIVKKVGLYVQCNKNCVNGTQYCTICSFNFNKITIHDRIVGGFKNKKPSCFSKIQCYKKTLKKHGLTITKIKKQAKNCKLTLNMEFINEVSQEICNNRTIDVSVVTDTSDEEEQLPNKRPRGRPKKINENTNDDLIRNMTANHETHICEESESETDYESEDEITVEPFKYTGHQQKYRCIELFIDGQDLLYDKSGNWIGRYYQETNLICDAYE